VVNKSFSQKRALYYSVLQYQKENMDLLKQNFLVTTLANPNFDTPEILNSINVVFAPLGFFWGKDKIDAAPQLKIIASNTTGVPHIDTVYAQKKRIEVISLQGRTGFLKTITPTAELTFGLILALLRRIPWAFESVRNGTWNRRLFGAPAMLSKMNLGIVGLGRLGRLVAKCALGFNMKVYYFDPYVTASDIDGIIKTGSLEELVSLCDVVSIHVVLNEETNRLFNEQIFPHFKKGALLINTSRGEIIDEKALLKYLENGQLAGAAVDVMTGEFSEEFSQKIKMHPLIVYAKQHENLLITPHIGGSTIDAWRLTEEYVINLVIDKFTQFDACQKDRNNESCQR
jgi:D-3-phosphoglycerate dehydrogenase